MTKFLLAIDDKLWEKWKKNIPRDVSLNEHITNLLKKDMGDRENAKNRT